MKLYRLTSGQWVGTQAAWKEGQKAEGADASGTPEPIEVPINPKGELIAFLNSLESPAPAVAAETTVPTIIREDGPTTPAELFNKLTPSERADMFEALPLRARMDMAVSTIDEAGKSITNLVTLVKQLQAQQ